MSLLNAEQHARAFGLVAYVARTLLLSWASRAAAGAVVPGSAAVGPAAAAASGSAAAGFAAMPLPDSARAISVMDISCWVPSALSRMNLGEAWAAGSGRRAAAKCGLACGEFV